ncbi:MAG: ankyrin repeat domain-containing protein [Chryseolinea sp.]
MKTQNTLSLKAAAQIAFLIALVMTTACTDKKASAEQSPSLAEKSNVKPPDVDIHTAVLTENVAALKQHIAAGSNLNEKDPFGGSSPLITSAVFGKNDMAKILIDAGADLNFQNKDGSTALHTAAFFCRPEIVKMLLDKHADKTIKNSFNSTAYESVIIPFKDVKGAYDMMGTVLGPMGLKLDYVYIEKTRPEIAAMLK